MKERDLETCSKLEDLIVIAAVNKYPGVDEIRSSLEYFMERFEITSKELTTYQIKKQKESK